MVVQKTSAPQKKGPAVEYAAGRSMMTAMVMKPVGKITAELKSSVEEPSDGET